MNRRIKQLTRFFRDGVPNTPIGHSLIKRTLRGLTQAESNNLDSILCRHMATKALKLRTHTYATSNSWTDLSSQEEWKTLELYTHKQDLVRLILALTAAMQSDSPLKTTLLPLLTAEIGEWVTLHEDLPHGLNQYPNWPKVASRAAAIMRTLPALLNLDAPATVEALDQTLERLYVELAFIATRAMKAQAAKAEEVSNG